MRTAATALLAALALGAVANSAARAADVRNGATLAQRWCADCHVISEHQQRANADAPPFAAIAKMPGFNAEKLAFFLLEPHPRMPSMSLSRGEAQDLAAYIASLAN